MENQQYKGYPPQAVPLRSRSQEGALAVGVTQAYIADMVDDFYARIQRDTVLGPIFDAHIDNWPAHLSRMKLFWQAVLHNSGAYSGSPMQKHIAIPGLTEAHFARWLSLFDQTLAVLEPHPDATALVASKARMIAGSLLNGIEMQDTRLKIPAVVAGQQDGFQLPGWIWKSMLGCYAVFFMAIALATGRDGSALFAIAISVGYAVMYFGLGWWVSRIKGRERPSPLLEKGGVLQTWCGPMDMTSVAGQVLAVPACIALFALAVMIVCMTAV